MKCTKNRNFPFSFLMFKCLAMAFLNQLSLHPIDFTLQTQKKGPASKQVPVLFFQASAQQRGTSTADRERTCHEKSPLLSLSPPAALLAHLVSHVL